MNGFQLEPEARAQLLEQVASHIERNPYDFSMGIWGDCFDFDETGAMRCGSACCIAGTICVLSKADIRVFGIPRTACNLLNLSYEQESNLFYFTNWPEPYKDQFEKAEDIEEREARWTALAKIGAARVRHFAATGR